jgi:membrane protease YdiL (CAAX protease family)
MAMGVACSATLAGLLGGDELVAEAGDFVRAIAGCVVVGVVTLLTCLVHGGFGGAFPLRSRPSFLLAAIPAGLLTIGVAMLYVQLLPLPELEATRESDDRTAWPWSWLSAVVLAPLGEELLCRGALWRSATALGSPRTALAITSVVFAFLHGLGGIYLLELPHRAFCGVVFGWLRWRSGSVLPGMLAHAVHNGVAITLLE